MSFNKSENVFQHQSVAAEYDSFYQSETGKLIDSVEKELITSHLQKVSGDKLLELGCGTGHWTGFFSEAGYHVTAVDNSDAMLEIAGKKQIRNAGFLKADAGKLPFTDNSFQTVVSITMLEFVDDVYRVLNEIDRILTPGGTLILGCLNALSVTGVNKENDPVFKFSRFFTPDEVKNMLSGFGKPVLSPGVFLSQEFRILDNTPLQDTVQPVFIAASVKKNK